MFRAWSKSFGFLPAPIVLRLRYLYNVCVSFVLRVFVLLLLQSLGAGEKDDRDVIAAIEASKRENTATGYGKEQEEEEDPEILKAMAESR